MKRLRLTLLLLAAASLGRAAPVVVLSYPAAHATALSRDEVVTVVVDRGAYTVNGVVVPPDALVSVVDTALQTRPSGVVCVYLRPDVTLGDVVKSMDCLRTTHAVTLALARLPLPFNREM